MLLVTVSVVTAVLAAVAARALRSDDDEYDEASGVPITPIADVAEGDEVVIAGRLELAGAPLCAPVSGRACAAYSATIEYHDLRCRRRIVREAGAREFLVRDDSGVAALVRAPLRLRGGRSAVLRPTVAASRPSRRLRRFLKRHGIGALPSLEGKPYADRCDETTLQSDERVAVVGIGRWEPDPTAGPTTNRQSTAGYRDAPKRIVFSAATVIAKRSA
ncbi:MAG TPA: hypothetical protein VGH63_17135 [Polyangia bacterium]|jgi:hypothetical protein